jgi:4-carboxymuconolactone decarboxylase
MRIPDATAIAMSVEQQAIAAESAAGKRGHVPAPMRAWLHSPQLAARAQKLGEFLRYDTRLGPFLSELAILVVARKWSSRYEWFAHKREALKAGVPAAVIDAIGERRAPEFTESAHRAVYAYAQALVTEGCVTDPVHAEAVAALGVVGVVELVGIIGYYSFAAMTLNAFEITPPEGSGDDLPA